MHKLTTALALIAVSSLAQASDSAILKCREITSATQRFDCYEKIQVGATSAALAAAPVAAVAPAPAKSDTWGMQKRPDSEPKMVQGELDKMIDGWSAGTILALTNGQKWRVSDGSDGVMRPTNKVTIERGVLGNFYMTFEGKNKLVGVTRIQ